MRPRLNSAGFLQGGSVCFVRKLSFYLLVFLSSTPSLPGRAGPGTTDQAAGTHSLVPDAAPSVSAIPNTVRAVMWQGAL